MTNKNKPQGRKTVKTLIIYNGTITKNPQIKRGARNSGGVVILPSKFIGKCVQVEVIEAVQLSP